MESLQAGGGTPLSAALCEAEQFQQQQQIKQASIYFKNYLITDGRVSQLPNKNSLSGNTTVIDIEQSQVKRGKAKQLSAMLNAHYIPLTS